MHRQSHGGRKIGQHVVFFVTAIVTSQITTGTVVLGAAYAYSGTSITNLLAFWENSVADSTDLQQGPNRDGTGRQLERSDLGGTYIVGNGGGNNRVEFENWTTYFGSGNPPHRCVGDCFSPEDDFSRPPLSPIDPTGGLHFARADGFANGHFFSVAIRRTLEAKSVAEMELSRDPSRSPSLARGRLQWLLGFRPSVSDELVFDFDADTFVRVLNHPDVPHTVLNVSNTFQITIEEPQGNIIFRFSPDGTGESDIGGTIVADPISLNDFHRVGRPSRDQELQQVGGGQVRAISPTLAADTFYWIRVDQQIQIEAVIVPEPSSWTILCFGIAICMSFRLLQR